MTFLALLLNIFLFSLNATTLGVAMPAIVADLGGSTLESFWTSNAYILAVLVTQPLYATISGIMGRKMPLYSASVLFFIGSLVFALAQNMAQLIAGRVIQGLGGSGLDLLAEIIVTDMTTLKERPLYLGLVAVPTALGTVLGPSLGGIFSSYVSWRWIGWFNLPVVGASSVLVWFFLRLRPLEKSQSSWARRFDWLGICLFAAGSTLFALPVSWAGTLFSWGSWPTILALILGAALVAAFAVYERWPDHPIMPYRLFHSRTATMTLVGAFFHGMSMFSLLQWLPLIYQGVLFKSIIQAAVVLIPTCAAFVVFAIAGVVAVGIVGKGYRWSISLSWALTTAGTGLLVLIDEKSSTALIYGAPLLWATGMGLLLRLLFLPNQASVQRVDGTGLAIASLMTIRLIGALLGIAACATIFSSLFARSIAAVDNLPESLTVLRDPNEAIRLIPELRTLDLSEDLSEDLSIAIRRAYLTPIRAILYFMIGVDGAGFLTSYFIKDVSLHKTEMSEQRFEA
ncbi:major facilitator superfamily domain-containing protein [Xylariomycetidae sp. FL2044]|nr:major facilitator superfamily domain-containing protein [Xylariomycetidae sp. FL2044]